ncbi:hypothetical protein BH10BAC6_BH10BAC6_02310 [soil metagenome]
MVPLAVWNRLSWIFFTSKIGGLSQLQTELVAAVAICALYHQANRKSHNRIFRTSFVFGLSGKV